MASIRRRNGRYHVQIRKNGYQTLTHTLSSLSLARKWAAGVEADMERHLHIEVSEQTTLLSLLIRYQDQVIPLHKGSKSEQYRIQHLKKHLGHLRLIHLSPHEVLQVQGYSSTDGLPCFSQKRTGHIESSLNRR